ncbi:MAG: transporter substrate-binding domain-containing protein [Candidatus Omnitrophica bacterium]|nr:transporter substrate-binding domain-containing protein [Candidatus Omnitrophota bacterium]
MSHLPGGQRRPDNRTPRAPGLWLCAAAAFCALFITAPALTAENTPLVIVMSGDTPPYHSVDSHGNLKGLDIDVARAVGRELKRKVTVKIMPAQEVAEMLDDGRADIAVGVIVNPAVEKTYVLSRPYLYQRARLFIHEKTNVVQELADLNHLRISIRDGIDVGEMLRLIQPANRLVEPSAESGLKNLMTHAVDVFVGDEYESHYVIQKQQLKEITTVGDPVMLRKRVFAVHQDRAGLADQITQAIDDLQKNYRLQEMQDQWLARRIGWMGDSRLALGVFLGVIGLMTVVLLGSVLWNQRLAEAIADRTREVEIEHEHFQNIFDHASDGIVVIDPESLRPVESNRTFLGLLQYSLEDLKAIRLSDLDASPDHALGDHIRRAFSSGENVLFEVRLINRSREPIDLFIHARAFPYRGKKMVEAIARDITQRKKLEAMKDTILQDVAHELKTPMAKLAVSLELLEQKLPDEIQVKTGQQLDVCRRAVGRLQQTVDGILHLSRLESNAAQVEMGQMDLTAVVEGVTAEFRDLAERKGVGLIVHHPDRPLRIQGDQEMIRRLFVNLIHNAIKFTDGGEVAVTLQTDGEFAKITVSDTGVGLEAGDLSRIFGRFFQKTAAAEGSGVGLTIAQKIVTFHNGVVWAESQGLGKGTQMHVLLPQ